MSEMISPLEAVIQRVKAKLDEFKATWPKEVEWDYVMEWDGEGEFSRISISMGAHGFAFPVFHLKQKNDPKYITDRMVAPESRMFSMWRQVEDEIATTTVKEAYEAVLKKNREDARWWAHSGCKNIPLTPDEVVISNLKDAVVMKKLAASTPPDSNREILFSNGRYVMKGVYAPKALFPTINSDKSHGFIDQVDYDKDFGYESFEENIIWWMELPDPK